MASRNNVFFMYFNDTAAEKAYETFQASTEYTQCSELDKYLYSVQHDVNIKLLEDGFDAASNMDVLIDYLLRKTQSLKESDYTIPPYKANKRTYPAKRRKYSTFTRPQKEAFAKLWNDFGPQETL